MAQTTGFVQLLTISTSVACAQIGPSPNDAEQLAININSGDNAAVVAFQISIIDALAAALATKRTVVATHGDQDPLITQIVINPA